MTDKSNFYSETSELLTTLNEILAIHKEFRIVQPKLKRVHGNDKVLLDIQDSLGCDLLSILKGARSNEFERLTNYMMLSNFAGKKLLTTSWETRGHGGIMRVRSGHTLLGLIEISGCWKVNLSAKYLTGQPIFKIEMNRSHPEYWIKDQLTQMEVCRITKNNLHFIVQLNQDLIIESKAIALIIACLIFMQFHAKILYGTEGIRGARRCYILYAIFVVFLIVIMILLTYLRTQ